MAEERPKKREYHRKTIFKAEYTPESAAERRAFALFAKLDMSHQAGIKLLIKQEADRQGIPQ
ncbi:hypothetical protein [Hymenobacter metallicola]|uniref:Uncharacterized protein n=1 Tax=Hymenobacter metallicola TaxID=2563114 RepID=A0A4Z0QIC3_9BACT|nr:hypothetical protein [Hymenobacter metallicola]TGE29817.1 hypothetical protein E5K02_10260 [Hymenobacter metallicola]